MSETNENDLMFRSVLAHVQSQQTFHTDQEEDWRDEVAAQLNLILGRVQYEMETCIPPDSCDVEFAEATLSIVQRVANFEEIKRAGKIT